MVRVHNGESPKISMMQHEQHFAERRKHDREKSTLFDENRPGNEFL
jgi:hypothetical protein